MLDYEVISETVSFFCASKSIWEDCIKRIDEDFKSVEIRDRSPGDYY